MAGLYYVYRFYVIRFSVNLSELNLTGHTCDDVCFFGVFLLPIDSVVVSNITLVITTSFIPPTTFSTLAIKKNY